MTNGVISPDCAPATVRYGNERTTGDSLEDHLDFRLLARRGHRGRDAFYFQSKSAWWSNPASINHLWRGAGSFLEAYKHLTTAWQSDERGVALVAAVLRAIALHLDLIAGLQVRLFPAAGSQAGGAAQFETPFCDFAFSILSVDVQPRVRIDPLEFRHCARNRNATVLIVLGGE